MEGVTMTRTLTIEEMLKACKTLDDLKNKYRELAKKYHPDLNDYNTTEIMKMINDTYSNRVQYLLNNSDLDQDKQDFQANEAEHLKDILTRYGHLEDLDIEICGTWVWFGGDTKKYLKQFQEDKTVFWGRTKKKWYYKPEGSKCFNRKVWSMDKIRNTYGSRYAGKHDRPQELS